MLKKDFFLKNDLMLTALGSLLIFLTKILLISTNHYFKLLSIELSYLIIHLLIFLISWLYHSSISFKSKQNQNNLYRFIKASIGIKLIDYLLVISIAAFMSFHPSLFVFISSSIIFFSRYIIYKFFVFK